MASTREGTFICVSLLVSYTLGLVIPQARGRMRALTLAGLLSTLGEGGEQRWEMHACVRAAACDLSEALGLSHAAYRCTNLSVLLPRQVWA